MENYPGKMSLHAVSSLSPTDPSFWKRCDSYLEVLQVKQAILQVYKLSAEIQASI